MTEPSKDRYTVSGNPPAEGHWNASAPAPIDETTKQYKDHWVLPPAQRAQGFVRPVRDAYRHEKCGTVTTMPKPIAETYAKRPDYYGSTFCCGCKDYFKVGKDGEFVWLDDGTKVGT